MVGGGGGGARGGGGGTGGGRWRGHVFSYTDQKSYCVHSSHAPSKDQISKPTTRQN
jgi:hypothetical protein